jgi:hypothetical protein
VNGSGWGPVRRGQYLNSAQFLGRFVEGGSNKIVAEASEGEVQRLLTYAADLPRRPRPRHQRHQRRRSARAATSAHGRGGGGKPCARVAAGMCRESVSPVESSQVKSNAADLGVGGGDLSRVEPLEGIEGDLEDLVEAAVPKGARDLR